MQLFKIEDNRDALDRMSRDELWALAVEHGVQGRFPKGRDTPHSDYTSMQNPNMVSILRALGIRAPDMSHRVLGVPIDWHNDPAVKPPEPQPKSQPPSVQPIPKRAGIVGLARLHDLRRECKAKGIATDRKDNIASLEAKLRSHEIGQQDAPRRHQ